MVQRYLRFAFSAVSCLAVAVGAAEPPAGGGAGVPTAGLTDAQLVDRLVDVTNAEFSLRTNIFAGNALPQGLLMLNDPALTPARAKQELTRRGVAALPELLRHLDDARKTNAVIKGMFSGIRYSAEFDWNARTDNPRPAGVVASALGGDKEVKVVNPPNDNAYTVSVGDLCFDVIGDIVNRRYEPVRYQPTAIVIVNSPVLCPDLRDAVRGRWAGLTAEQHRRSLIADVVKPDRSSRDQAGLGRLLRYYPQDAVAAFRERIAAPTYEFGPVRDFAEKLYAIAGEAERKRLIDEFVVRNGAVFKDALILHLWRDRYTQAGDDIPYATPAEKVKASPRSILASLLGKVDNEVPPLIDPAVYADAESLIEALGEIESPEIDRIVWETFLKCRAKRDGTWGGDDRIAAAAVVRLAHKEHDAELTAYVRRRLSELRADEANTGAARLEALMGHLARPRVKPGGRPPMG